MNKTDHKINDFSLLEGELLQRFRTRGQRRKASKPLSPLWPAVWVPETLLNAEQISSYQSKSFTLSAQQQSKPAFKVEHSQQGLKIYDAEHHGLLISMDSKLPLFTAQIHNLKLVEERGFFHLKSSSKGKYRRFFTTQGIQHIEQVNFGQINIQGTLIEVNRQGQPLSTTSAQDLEWQLTIQVLERNHEQRACSLSVQCPNLEALIKQTNGTLSFALHLDADPDETIFGMGAQLTWLDLKGKIVPAWVQEPGIGRGLQPLTWLMEKLFGAGGSDVQSSAPAPIYLSSQLQMHALENKEFSLFDFTKPHTRSIEVWSNNLRLQVFSGQPHPQGLLKSLSAFTGQMPPLPKWVHKGAIIGAQGGTQRIMDLWQKLTKAGVKISAFWLQDWVGKRETSVGEQLWWDWRLDQSHYPKWPKLRAELNEQNIKILGYVNPYLVPTDERKKTTAELAQKESHKDQTSLFQIALNRGYLIRDHNKPSQALMVKNTSFSAAIVDLSKPEAFAWLKEVIKTELINQGMSGWMADFGEALPVEVELHQGSGLSFHNRFPELWAQLNRELLDELEQDIGEREYLFFNRAGFTQTPQYSHLTWLGDQLTSWKKYDGIYSALVGLLSSGFSGVSLSHSDAGGYICTDPPRSRLRFPWISYVRSKELLMRWVEMNTFSAILRTHEGNQPERHHQVYDDEESLAHFAKMSRLYQDLAPVRTSLMPKLKDGMPLLAHPWLYYPQDPYCLELQEQMMLGHDLMIAPVIRQGWTSVKLYLPQGQWKHWWSEHKVEGPRWLTAPAPLGQPAVFYREGSLCEAIADKWKIQEAL